MHQNEGIMVNASPAGFPENGPRAGRRPSTSPQDLENTAFALFDRYGFEDTTVEEISQAAGISRRTFFRYFDSKNDVVWGNFTGELNRMRGLFDACPDNEPLMDAVCRVVVEFNRVDSSEVVRHRRRLQLILSVPALQAHSTLRFADWRAVVAGFAARHLGTKTDALVPQAIAHASLGVALASYERWLACPELNLCEVLDNAMTYMARGFNAA